MLILKNISSSDFIVLLDEKGEDLNSIGFSLFIEKKHINSNKSLVFIIGGAYGFSDEIYQRANKKIRLSSMTFSHQMIRLFFLEQLYRSFSIIKKENTITPSKSIPFVIFELNDLFYFGNFLHFSATDLLSAFLWLIIILLIVNNRTQKQDEKIRSYYLWNVVYKLFFSLVFALIYILYYGGGDTTAYWDGANCLNNLLFEKPGSLLTEFFSEADLKMMYANFNNKTGYPPGWIYKEPSAWFICKISFFLSLITFKSYLAATFIISFIVANASWSIFSYLKNIIFYF